MLEPLRTEATSTQASASLWQALAASEPVLRPQVENSVLGHQWPYLDFCIQKETQREAQSQCNSPKIG